VRVIQRDTIADPSWMESESLDGLASFATIEHFHHSPKTLFRLIVEALNPGGLFFVGAPSSKNLRKRLALPLGLGKWSSMDDGYDQVVLRPRARAGCGRPALHRKGSRAYEAHDLRA